MDKTFLDVLSQCRFKNDKLSVEFVKYIMKKYFDEQRIFMPINEAIPYLEQSDRDQLYIIMEEILRR